MRRCEQLFLLRICLNLLLVNCNLQKSENKTEKKNHSDVTLRGF